MRPSDQVLVAGVRWVDLLRRNTLAQAWILIGTDPHYSDLSRSQYHAGIEWLLQRGLAVDSASSLELDPRAKNIDANDLAAELLTDVLSRTPPPWLLDADDLLREPDDLPQDACSLATVLGLTPTQTLRAIRHAQRKVDLDSRRQVGLRGELALLEALEGRWPGSTTHVAATDDAAGYDIAVTLPGGTTHIEVKSTNRRGRLDVFLSRHEYETARVDPAWLLVVVGLDPSSCLCALATVSLEVLKDRAPTDSASNATWDSARFTLDARDLETGLRPFGAEGKLVIPSASGFAWMPTETHGSSPR